MRKLLVAIPLFLGLAYAAWPAWSAWQLRSAVKARDIATIERKVDWPLLRANLKRTVGDSLRDDGKNPDAGIFTRAFKRTLPMVVDPVIDTAVTPRTLSHVLAGRVLLNEFKAKMPGRRTTSPAPADEAEVDAEAEADPLPPRRLRWAFFESPTRFRIEVADRKDPNRRIVSVLELQGVAWRLVDVYYRTPA